VQSQLPPSIDFLESDIDMIRKNQNFRLGVAQNATPHSDPSATFRVCQPWPSHWMSEAIASEVQVTAPQYPNHQASISIHVFIEDISTSLSLPLFYHLYNTHLLIAIFLLVFQTLLFTGSESIPSSPALRSTQPCAKPTPPHIPASHVLLRLFFSSRHPDNTHIKGRYPVY